jgi:hypothetical protein
MAAARLGAPKGARAHPAAAGGGVLWQATVTSVIGLVVGIPIGIVIGRQLWTVFTNNINAVPDPTVPALSVVLVATGALVFAVPDAALPGRAEARTPAAIALRSD